MRVLVTGANGFVGGYVCSALRAQGYEVRAAVRCAVSGGAEVAIGEIGALTDWSSALVGIDAVIHLAGRAHVMDDSAADPEAAYHQVNVEGSVALARQAVAAGVSRLVYVSSIKASGEQTQGRPFSEADEPAPEDAYGRSKLAAERALGAVANETGLELVVVRPVMVVGRGVKGNLALLTKVLRRGLPLPFGSLRNRRSMVSVSSLADLLVLCVQHPAAVGETFLAAAPEVLSTADLVRSLAAGVGCRARLWPFPCWGLSMFGVLCGRREQVRRLTTDLEVDASRARHLLGWQAKGRLSVALQDAARGCADNKE